MSQKCFVGAHLAMMPFAVAVLVVFVIGFPLFCGWTVHKLKKPTQSHSFFLFFFQGLRNNLLWFRLTSLPSNFLIALMITFNVVASIQLLVYSIYFLAILLIVLMLKPFANDWMNIFHTVGGLVRIGYFVILLRYTTTANASTYFYIVLALLLTTVMFVVYLFVQHQKSSRPFNKISSMADTLGDTTIVLSETEIEKTKKLIYLNKYKHKQLNRTDIMESI